jgi:hypothetical protein
VGTVEFMALRRCVVLAALLVLAGAVPAAAKKPVQPQAGVQLSGMIDFPRQQRMTIQTDAADGSRLSVAMGFDGRCKGGGLGELWAANVRATPEIRVRDGRIAANLTGTSRALGQGRTGVFKWRLTGRFVARDVVVATVTGSAEVRVDGKTVSKCRIAGPADVRLAVRGA